MKPRLGRKVFIVFHKECILEREVYALSKHSFITEDVEFLHECRADGFRFKFDDYNEVWFTSFARAKRKLLQVCYEPRGTKAKCVKIADGYWEAVCERKS